MTIRILALVGDCYGAQGGIARYNQDLFEALAHDGAEIVILPRLGDAAGLSLPRRIRQNPPIFGPLRFSVASLAAAWRHRPVNVVFCGHVFMAPLAWLLARLFGARYWLQAHGIDILPLGRGRMRRAVEAADLVTTVSRMTRKDLLERADLLPERVRVLPNTVRGLFMPGPPSEELRARFGLGPGPLLLTVGRLAASERYKGHELIFAALPALRAEFPDLVHVVAGDPAAVRFLGYVPEKELPSLYRLADLFVMPSSLEGFGIVYLEAAACGLRVVGGIGGGSADAIPDGRVGVTVDPKDREALIAAVRRSLGQGRADQSAVEPYRQPHFAAAANKLLARLLSGAHRMKSIA